MSIREEILEEVLVEEQTGNQNEIVLFNANLHS